MLRRLLSVGAALLLGGCMVGPDFHAPQWASPASWFSGNPRAAGVSSLPVAEPVNADWWSIFHDPTLTELERHVAGSNLDVQVAAERILESRSELGVTGASLYPTFNANGSYERQKASNLGVFPLLGSSAVGTTKATQANGAYGSLGAGGAAASSNIAPFDLFQYGFDASWEPDIWGQARRSVEAARASLEAAEWARRSALISALAELARDYVSLRGTQEQLRIARDNLRTAEQGLALTRERAQAGVTTDLDVANAAAQVRTTAAQIPTLEAQERELINALGLLLAEPPGALRAELATPRAVPPVPARVPIGFPSELARRRPDILQAEAQLHAATATIGVAKADFYPSITLSASAGFQALVFGKLFNWNARQWALGPGINLPIFEGGRLRYTLLLRTAQQREAALSYRQTVLNAWTEVDNDLASFEDEQRRRSQLVDAVAQNRRALALARARYQQGVADFLQVLDAERSVLATEQQLASSTTTVSTDVVALYKALGGGWENKEANTRF